MTQEEIDNINEMLNWLNSELDTAEDQEYISALNRSVAFYEAVRDGNHTFGEPWPED